MSDNLRLLFSPAFVKQSSLLKKKDLKTLKKLKARIKTFKKNPYHPSLRTHKLKGKLTGRYAFSVTDDIRVVFRWLNEDTILFIALGSHDQVYH